MPPPPPAGASCTHSYGGSYANTACSAAYQCCDGSWRGRGVGRCGFCRRRSRGDFPGQIQQVDDADHAQHVVAERIGVEHADQTHPHQHHHDHEADTDAEHVRHRATDAEVGAGSHQHQVVRPWGDGADQGEQGESSKELQVHEESRYGGWKPCNCAPLFLAYDCKMAFMTRIFAIYVV